MKKIKVLNSYLQGISFWTITTVRDAACEYILDAGALISRIISVLCIIITAALLTGCEKNAGNSSADLTGESKDIPASCIQDSEQSAASESVTDGNVPDVNTQTDRTGWTKIDMFEGIEYYSFSDSEEYRTISESNENTLYPVTVYPELQNNPYWNQFCSEYLNDEQREMVYQTGSTGTAGYFTGEVTEIIKDEIPCYDVLHLGDSDKYITLPVTDSLTFTLSFKSDELFTEYLEDNHYVIGDIDKNFTVKTAEFETVKKCAEECISRRDNHENVILTDLIFGGVHNLSGDEKYIAKTGYEAAETYRKHFAENEFCLYPENFSDFKWDWCQEFIMTVKDDTARSYYPVRVIKIRNNSTVVWAADYPFNDIVFTPDDWDSCTEDYVNEFFKDELAILLGQCIHE